MQDRKCLQSQHSQPISQALQQFAYNERFSVAWYLSQ